MPTFTTDQGLLSELGRRLAQYRLSANLTQAQLAAQAGVSKRTLERAEAGESIQLITLIRLLRELGLSSALEQWLAPPKPSPLEQLAERKLTERKGHKKRVRASKAPNTAFSQEGEWEWGPSA